MHVDVKSNDDNPVVEALSNSVEEYYVTHDYDLWKIEKWMNLKKISKYQDMNHCLEIVNHLVLFQI